MTIQQSIEKAKSGGYKHPECDVRWTERSFPIVCGHPLPCFQHGKGENYSMFLDPLFWQSLGKAIGWQENIVPRSHYQGYGAEDLHLRVINGTEWIWHWHRFIDHLAEGKDAESFFETLTK